jgi:hypothetical protein
MSAHVKRIVTVALFLVATTGAGLAAHPMTVKGTVAAIEPKRIQVKTGEEKKGESPEWVVIDAKTKIMRDKTLVTFEQAKIKVGERVVVNADHGADGIMRAVEIRLAAR